MPEICTCGAQLPPDALFCHKCGKPQREITEPENLTPPPLVPEVAPPPPVEVPRPSFRNPIAFRIVLGAAAAGTLLSFVLPLSSLAAGYFAFFFYRRKTGARPNMEYGVRLGWMTGVLMFLMIGGLLTLSVVMYRGVPEFQEQLNNFRDPRLLESVKILQSGREFFKMLVSIFVFTGPFGMAGGALGSRLAGRS
jgi:hypothetical protein